MNENWTQHAPTLLDYEDSPVPEKHMISKRLWDYYLGNKSLDSDTIHDITDMFSDMSFNRAFEAVAHVHSAAAPLYLYLYSHRGEFGIAQAYMRLSLKVPILLDGLLTEAFGLIKKYILNWPDPHYGVCHGDEMAMFFKMHPLLSTINPGSKDFNFSRSLVSLWASFAKNG